MVAGIICYSIIGIVMGAIFCLHFVNFDKSWKKIASSLVSFGGAGGIIVCSDIYFGINEQQMKFWATSSLYMMFLISFVSMMLIMCRLIKDKDDADVLRIRDILLVQKSYIDKYYEKRAKEIDEKLNINNLNKIAEELHIKENSLAERMVLIEKEEEKINELGRKKLRLLLPENAMLP